ncbi:MAG: tetratricopeptide repeat protein [Allorhizobium sp.]
MRQKLAIRFLSGAALTVILSLGAATFSRAQTVGAAAEATDTKPFDVNSVDTFSGAFLAARTADSDRDFTNSIALYKKALSFMPGDVEIRQRLMLALFMSGNFDEGVKYATELKSDPAVERVTSVARGLSAIRNREYNAAEKILTYKGPNDLDRLMNSLLVAWARLGAGKGKEALALVEGLKGPAWYGIFQHYNAGAMASVLGNVEVARRNLNEVVTDREGGATAPDTYLRAVMALAVLEAKAGEKQKALDALSAGDALVNDYAPFKALRAAITNDKAPEQQVTDATNGAAGVLFSIGGALNRQGAEDTVALYLQLSYALDPNSADTLLMLGSISESAGRTDEAIGYYSKVPETSPMRRISELQLGLTLAQTGKIEDAEKHLKALIASDPADIRSYLAYGSVLSDAKDYAGMAETYDRAVEAIGPAPTRGNWSVFFQRGIAYERLKQWDKAEPNFRKALELNPDQPQVLNYLGYSWVDMNRNLAEGLELIRKAVELKPDDGYIVDSLGWAYFRMNRFDEAVTELERAIELKAGDAAINDHLGDAYWRVGRRLEAVFQWKRALISKPDEAEIVKIQAKIDNGLPDIKTDAAQTADKPVTPEEKTPEQIAKDKKS